MMGWVFAQLMGCGTTREFWRYVVEDDVSKTLPRREEGERDTPKALSPHNVKVVYNDGAVSTEVLIPILSSGQQILIDHKGRGNPESLRVVPVPPTSADKSVEDAYLQSGQPVVQKAAPVSIVKTHEKIRDLARQGQYELALQYADQLLARYPNHVKTLRTKGSLLLKIGEREAALKTYYRAQEIEPDAKVAEQISNLERQLNGTGGSTNEQ
jgi:tetratricopeptide (TPR) repeat protein